MMKKILCWTMAMATASGIASIAKAEVQNVRVTGDIRARVYYTKNIDTLDSNAKPDDSYSFVNQRTRVAISGDLTEGVSSLVEMEAFGVWGDEPANESPFARDDRNWDVSLSQAYVQFSEMFGSPVTVRAGRQYLNFGRGLLISSNEEEYKFDAAKMTAAFGDAKLDLVLAQLKETLRADMDTTLYGVNLGYSQDTFGVEAYVFAISDKHGLAQDVVYDSFGSPSHPVTSGLWAADMEQYDVSTKPVYLGLRGDVKPVGGMDVWGEFVYEDGKVEDYNLNAKALDTGLTYNFENAMWTPGIKLAYTYAQGGSEENPNNEFFAPFNYTYYGYVMSPALANIHILNAQVNVAPVSKVTLALDYYYYTQDQKQVTSVGNPDLDNGGVMARTNGTSKRLGNEIDLTASYKYTEDVATKLLAGWFMPGKAYSSPNDDTAFEIRGEVVVNF